MRFTLLTALALVAAQTSAQPPKRAPAPPPMEPRAARTMSIPLPPTAITGLVTEGAFWSGDGRYLLAQREDFGILDTRDLQNAKPVPAIVLWNAATRKATEIWRGQAGNARVDSLDWMGPSPFALAVVALLDAETGPARHLIRIDARRSGAEDLGVLDQGEQVYACAVNATAALVVPVEGGAKVRTLRGAAAPSEAFAVPNVSPSPGWTADGRSLCFGPPARPKGEAGPPPKDFVTFDLATGRLGTTQARPQLPPERPAAKSGVRLIEASSTLTHGKTSEPIKPLWVETGVGGPQEAYLLSPDSDWHEVSPAGDAIAYTSRGTLFVSPLLRFDAEALDAARSKALDVVAANNARQAMLGLIMYAADHDDTWPGGDTDIAMTLEPYIKAGDILKDFHYLPPGGKISDIANPATKAVGWIPAPSGYAVAFADGHVQLMPELPSN